MIESPPNSDDAERALLGAALIDAEVVNTVRLQPSDFYQHKHGLIWEAILAVARRGDPPDIVTVAAELEREGAIEAVGGRSTLAVLTNDTPTSLHAEAYAEIVRQKSLSRKLIGAAGQVAKVGYDDLSDPDESRDLAEAALYAVTRHDGERRMRAVGETLGPVVEALVDLRTNRQLPGVDTGIATINQMTGGLQPSDLIILAARPSVGKAQPMTARILTPTGFTTMGRIQVGDEVIGSNGQATRVAGVFPQGLKETVRVSMSDGSWTECSIDHLWTTQTRNEERRSCTGSVKTTEQIWQSLFRPGTSTPNHRLPRTMAVQFAPSSVPLLSPYLMGLLIGDGSFRGSCVMFSNPEQDIVEALQQELPEEDQLVQLGNSINYRIRRQKRTHEKSFVGLALNDYGLSGCHSTEKFIPHEYMFASVHDRQKLMCGLMDTDGHVLADKRMIEYSTSSPRLADDVEFVARSLGAMVHRSERIPRYSYRGERRQGAPAFRLWITPMAGDMLVSSHKHLSRLGNPQRRNHRAIVSIDDVGPKLSQCIAVEAEDGLYLTDSFIPTHNTSLALNIAAHVSTRRATGVGFFSLEMSQSQLMIRLLSTMTGIDGHTLRQTGLTQSDVETYGDDLDDLAHAKLYVDDTPNASVTEIRTKARRLLAETNLGLVVVDYLQLMRANNTKDGNRVQEISDISRGLKALARELNVPVLALSQLSRGVESRESNEPRLSDLRDSGAIEQDADVVMFLWRDKQVDAALTDFVQFKIAKHRNGPIGEAELRFDRRLTRFLDA